MERSATAEGQTAATSCLFPCPTPDLVNPSHIPPHTQRMRRMKTSARPRGLTRDRCGTWQVCIHSALAQTTAWTLAPSMPLRIQESASMPCADDFWTLSLHASVCCSLLQPDPSQPLLRLLTHSCLLSDHSFSPLLQDPTVAQQRRAALRRSAEVSVKQHQQIYIERGSSVKHCLITRTAASQACHMRTALQPTCDLG